MILKLVPHALFSFVVEDPHRKGLGGSGDGRVAEQFSDDDEVGAAADEGGGEGVSKDDVGGGWVVQAGVVGDLAEDAAGSAGGEAAPDR